MNRNRKSSRAVTSLCRPLWMALLLVVCGQFTIDSAFARELVIKVGEAADFDRDTSKGLLVAKDLQVALASAEKVVGDYERVSIEVAPGVYQGQRLVVRGNRHGIPLLITSGAGGRAVFDGGGFGGVWMKINAQKGQQLDLTIQRLEVRSYETAVDLRGSRVDPDAWVGGVKIMNNYFNSIGDIASPDAEPATAAIRLVNSDRNRISGNRFSNIRNREKCGRLHAIYLAHGSSDNVIENNTFEDSCGDAIRLRDGSNRNVVRKNRFVDAWAIAPVTEWYCNPSKRTDCTSVKGECPSNGTVIKDNDVVSISRYNGGVSLLNDDPAPDYCRVRMDD